MTEANHHAASRRFRSSDYWRGMSVGLIVGFTFGGVVMFVATLLILISRGAV